MKQFALIIMHYIIGTVFGIVIGLMMTVIDGKIYKKIDTFHVLELITLLAASYGIFWLLNRKNIFLQSELISFMRFFILLAGMASATINIMLLFLGMDIYLPFYEPFYFVKAFIQISIFPLLYMLTPAVLLAIVGAYSPIFLWRRLSLRQMQSKGRTRKKVSKS